MESTVFLDTFGDTPILKVLDFLTINDDFDYSMTDIAKFSGIGYSTLKLFWDNLEEREIVMHIRTVGKAKLYKLNMKNPIVLRFKDLYWETTRRKVHQTLNKKSLLQ
jgi:hypothetical protein